MISKVDVINKVDEYVKKYRKGSLPPLQISDLYALYPAKTGGAGSGWPGKYPYADSPGVYLMFDEDEKLLYIGKASMSNRLGGRISSYFKYDDDGKTCRPVHTQWSNPPHYIVAIAVPDESPFEAPAIEEFLIGEFKDQLPDNKLGKQ